MERGQAVKRSTGTLYGVGIGPGDPELITLKALRILKSVPVVAWPAPPSGESLARTIASPHLRDGQIEIPIRMPIEAQQFPSGDVYDEAARQIAGHLEAERDVATICEGDPFFYGSFMYLFGRMADRFPIEVVPGITSLTAAAAVLGSPLAAKNDILTVVPAPLDKDVLERRLADCDAAVIIKVGRHLDKLRRVLERLDLMKYARYVEYATMNRQRTSPLADVTAVSAPYFSIILIHKRGHAWQ
jgi:precorrin-2/cobalt-factor-2 C20-methyltransferase